MIQFNSTSILIPVDFSETSMLAIKHGAFMAQFTKVDLFLLHVINTHYGAQNMFLPLVSLENQSEIEKKATQKLAEISQDIQKEYGVKATSIVRNGSASHEISEVAKDVKASLIVMGTHGYAPLQELVIGSTALKVFTKAPCPTMAMNSEASKIGYNKVILPIDNTANTKQKVNYAVDFAKRFSASLNVIGLLDSNESSDAPAMEVVIRQIESRAKEKGVSFHSHIEKNVTNRAKTTVSYSEKVGGDVVIIMTDQDAELSGFFLGPYSQQIIHLSKVPVIAIKPKELYASSDLNFFSGSN